MADLQLSLIRNWFDKTESGEKTEDYREINEYWFKRLVFDHKKVFKYCTGYDWDDNIFRKEGIDRITNLKNQMFGFVPFEHNIMTMGYPSKDDLSRILKFKHAGIEIREGNPDWGAEKGVKYFVIKHGSRV